jgi:formylglycine-generating enzyme required for sulfatase activity
VSPLEDDPILEKTTLRDGYRVPGKSVRAARSLIELVTRATEGDTSQRPADADTGFSTSRCAVVSPPSPELTARIRTRRREGTTSVPTPDSIRESDPRSAKCRAPARPHRRTTVFLGVAVVILCGVSACSAVSSDRDESDAPRPIPGFTFAAQNPQGHAEYRHDKTGIIFVLIPGGSFEMGGDETEHRAILDSISDTDLEKQVEGWLGVELPRHAVTVDDFLLAKYEVTQAEWRRIMGTSPSYFKNAGDDTPVEQMSWNMLRGGGGANGPETFCGRTGLGLPTEAQWEYACRAGSRTAIYSGPLTIRGENHGPELDAIAWYGGNSGVTYAGGYDSSAWPEKQYPHKSAGTHPVGKKAPNMFGLYDMIGNVWEWCEDDYDAEFYGKPEAKARNPVSRSGSISRVVRGGSWFPNAWLCRSSVRTRLVASDAGGGIGGGIGVRPSFSHLP